MRVAGFSADADIVGRRVKVSWDVALDEGEGLGAAPRARAAAQAARLRVPRRRRRTTRSSSTTARRSRRPARRSPRSTSARRSTGGARTVTTAESVSREIDGVAVEVLRRTRTVTLRRRPQPESATARRSSTSSDRAAGLDPGTTYYYELAGDGAAGRRPRRLPRRRHPDRGAPLGPDALRPAARRSSAATTSTKGPARDTGADPGGRAGERPAAAVRRPLRRRLRPPPQPRRRAARPARRRHGRLPDAPAPGRVARLGPEPRQADPAPAPRDQVRGARSTGSPARSRAP